MLFITSNIGSFPHLNFLFYLNIIFSSCLFGFYWMHWFFVSDIMLYCDSIILALIKKETIVVLRNTGKMLCLKF